MICVRVKGWYWLPGVVGVWNFIVRPGASGTIMPGWRLMSFSRVYGPPGPFVPAPPKRSCPGPGGSASWSDSMLAPAMHSILARSTEYSS